MTILGALVGALIGLVLAPPIALALGLSAAALPLPPVSIGIQLSAVLWVVIYLVVVVVLYFIAAIATASVATPTGPQTATPVEQVARGAMIGLNAIMNVFLLPAAFVALAQPWVNVVIAIAAAAALPVALLIAPAVGVVGFLACIPQLSNAPAYQVVLGWTSLAMPMSWPITLVGAVILIANTLWSWFGGRPFGGFSDFTSGTWATHGGFVYFSPDAYNTGNFVQIPGQFGRARPAIDPANGLRLFVTARGVAMHEGAHNFNLAAFGWWFHLIGWFQEYLGPFGSGPNAYAELLPEGRFRRTVNPWLPVWTPSFTPAAVPNGPPVGGSLNVSSGCVFPGQTVSLSIGAMPTDDGFVHPLGFLWDLGTPSSSLAALDNPRSATPSFVPDVPGLYAPVLLVTDGADGTTVAIPFDTVKVRVPDPGPAQTARVDEVVSLPAGIDDPCPQFVWSIIDPPSPDAELNLVGQSVTFIAHTPGQYTLQATMTIGAGSLSATTTVDVSS
ncbi:MAG TPA: hypothetical protein VK572_12575 [Burkholderiales bacterium]|nr:hypothetical protein [Burkholderiales bacterium]